MIDRQNGRLVIECDSCAETFSGTKGEEFKETWARAKADGWRSKPVGADWVHSCLDCAGKA